MAPKIAPTANVTLDSNSVFKGIRKTKQEIKNDNIPPKNNFKNNQEPSLSSVRIISSVSVTILLVVFGEVLIKSLLSLLYL